ncbi:MAG: hypothetical protein AABX04_06670 [Nanoarchaeota archaeon]
MSERVKIDVYLDQESKKEILRRSKLFGLSISDYMKLKALDLLRDKDEKK